MDLKLISDAVEDLDDFISAFEAARHRQIDVDLSEFIPARDHPRYRDVVVEMIRVDLEHSWRQGAPKTIEDYRQQFADVLDDSQYLEPVLFEEYRLRRIAGEAVSREHYQHAYNLPTDTWPDLPLGLNGLAIDPSRDTECDLRSSSDFDFEHCSSLLVDVHHRLPDVGERFLDFELVSELGRGAMGRVYLARQGDLARRFVALKITTQGCDEAQHLAQLQHTNIVPVYSFHRHQQLQAVCMPFLGRRTLADVVHSYRSGQPLPDSGEALISTLGLHYVETISTEQSAEQQAAAIESQCNLLSRTDAVRRIEGMSFIDAATWMISRVADGLAHAHEHGIIHRDLKPANILLSDDGEPLILDFHLSAHRPDEAVNGGTLPYMSIEQLTALNKTGSAGNAIGPQSDIYSLGVILFELLTGTTPYAIRLGTIQSVLDQMLADRRQPPRSVRLLNKQVSSDLASIVNKCLSADPQQRYQTARQLHEDLLRHLEHRPLRFAASRSVVERGRKWARRHPRLSSATSIGILSLVLIAGLAGALAMNAQRLSRAEAIQSWRELQLELADARTTLNTPTLDRQSIVQSVDRVQRLLDQHDVFTKPDFATHAAFRKLDEGQRSDLKTDVAELLYLLASGSGQLAQTTSDSAESQRLVKEAIRFNELSQKILADQPPARAVVLQHQRLLKLAGIEAAPSESATFANSFSPTNPRDVRFAAMEAAAGGDFYRAIDWFQQLLQDTPQDPSVWFSLGRCYLELKQFTKAEQCFDMAIALNREFLLAYELRGMARLQLKQLQPSRDDFEHVLAKKPNSISALANHSLVLAEMGELGRAIQELSAAMDIEGCPTRLYFVRAGLYEKLGNAERAAEDRAAGLQLAPNDELSWIARGVARLATDANAALADFQEALRLNPRSLAARQNIAHVYAERLQRVDEAITVLNQMVNIDPADGLTRVTRGVLFARMGHRDEAVTDATAALQVSDQPLIVYQCACIYARTSKVNEADAAQALELFGRALQEDVNLSAFALKDPDLDPIRNQRVFKTLLSAAQTVMRK